VLSFIHGVPEARHHVFSDEPVERLDQVERHADDGEKGQHEPVEQVQPGDPASVGPQVGTRAGLPNGRSPTVAAAGETRIQFSLCAICMEWTARLQQPIRERTKKLTTRRLQPPCRDPGTS
jgi:hypothetical protein